MFLPPVGSRKKVYHWKHLRIILFDLITVYITSILKQTQYYNRKQITFHIALYLYLKNVPYQLELEFFIPLSTNQSHYFYILPFTTKLSQSALQ